MTFDEPDRKPPPESIVPMINVVFLLLVFFLMTATIVPPEPFDVTPPESTAGAVSEADQPLFVDADGQLAWGDVRGEGVYAAIATAREHVPGAPPLLIRADRELPAVRMAGILRQLAFAGITESQLAAQAAP